MPRNIYLAYLLTICKHSWFWFGIWIFYYLRFTNYAGIGLIETVLIITMTLAEIPTGAVADLLGKKKTLFLAFLIESLGAVWYSLTPNYVGLVSSVFIMCVGGAFYSGTLEALVYDTLIEAKLESKFDRVIATINSISLVTVAGCSLIGGFLYTSYFRLPFLANALFYFIGLFLVLFLTEPKVDTIKFSFANYLSQTKQGLNQLFKTPAIKNQTLIFIFIGSIVVIVDEMLNSFLAVDFGFKEASLGFFWALIYLAVALVSQLTPQLVSLFGMRPSIILIGTLMAVSLLVSPVLGLVTGGIVLFLRSIFQAVYHNLTSIAINQSTESKYRATTISSFNMLKNTPYICLAYAFGFLTDLYTSKTMAFGLGILLCGLLLFQIIQSKQAQTIGNQT